MTRRALFGLLLTPEVSVPQSRRKFYVTGGRLTTDGRPRNDCNVPPLITYGTNRVDALANSGITVWEAQDWENFQKTSGAAWKTGCQESALIDRCLPSNPQPGVYACGDGTHVRVETIAGATTATVVK